MTKLDFGLDLVLDEAIVDPLVYNPIDVIRTYGVILGFVDEKDIRLQIHYEMEVICIEKQNSYFIFELNKKQVYINEKAPDSTLDELAERCGGILYPLLIKVNRIGVATAIVNHKEIQDRWELEKQKIVQSFKGREIDRLINNMDNTIYDANKINELALSQDWFSTLIFAPIYQNTKNFTINFPIVPYQLSLPFSIHQKFEKHSINDGHLIIRQEGKCVERRNELDILNGNPLSVIEGETSTGSAKLEYHIFNHSSMINMLTGSIEVNFPSGKSKRIEIEIYNLKEKTPKSQVERKIDEGGIEEEDLKSKKPKKNFLSFFRKQR